METMKVVASPRSDSGKGAAHRLRAAGKIPAVAYGRNQPTRTLAVAPEDVKRVLAGEFGRNTVIELEVEGGERNTVLLCDYQYHPLTRELLHADFRMIRLDQPVELEVPFELTGKSKGVVAGGTLRHIFRRLPVSCLPTLVPAKISYDVTELDIDGHVSAGELELPEGVRVMLPPTQTVIAVVMVKEVVEETTTPTGVAGEGAAPAAEGAAAAAPAPAEESDKSKS
jgi:large subunit ribosomal protein L25